MKADYTDDFQERLEKNLEKENLSLKMFREMFPNISMEGQGWYREYLSNVELDRTLQGNNPNTLTDWYSPTLDCFFDYKADFTYLKHDSLLTYMRQVDECNIGRKSYILWWEMVQREDSWTSEIQWYVINIKDMWEDMHDDIEWDYYWNSKTTDYGGWNSMWMHLLHNPEGLHQITRLKNRHSYTFEEVFHIPKK